MVSPENFMPKTELTPTPEVLEQTRQIGIATGTLYGKWVPLEERNGTPDERTAMEYVRGDLALRTIRTAAEKGHPIDVVDGGSSEAFLNAVAEIDGVGLHRPAAENNTMSGQRRLAFQQISAREGVKAICWTEPEKVSFVSDCVITAAAPVLRGEADIVIPKRNKALFRDTYPSYQVPFEERANNIWTKVVKARFPDALYDLPEGEDADPWFGPRIIRNNPELMSLFQDVYKYEYKQTKEKRIVEDEETVVTEVPREYMKLDEMVKPEMWPNATFLPLIAAMHKGYSISANTQVPYEHPQEQTANEQNSPMQVSRRNEQLKGIITATTQLIRVLQPNINPARPDRPIPQPKLHKV